MDKNYEYWNEMYELAKKYKDRYGDLEVPYYFKTNDGITHDENGRFKLGAWISRQRYKRDPESEKGKLLSQIGMYYEKKSSNSNRKFAMYKWWEMYIHAVKFYDKNGHLDVPPTYKDENGVELGNWLHTQSRKYKENRLSSEMIYMLDSIGMPWEKEKNKFNVVVLCDKKNINIEKNKSVLKHISFIEFKCKIDYLEDNGISIVDENGVLHEIFYMSSLNMKLKYDVILEDLINMYAKERVSNVLR